MFCRFEFVENLSSMAVRKGISLLVCVVLLPALTLSQDIPKCPTLAKAKQDSDLLNYRPPLIDVESCDQRAITVFPPKIWWLTSTLKHPLQFSFTPHEDFEYFEVLFSRGRRSRAYNSLRVNKTLVEDGGPYTVSISFRNHPDTSTTPAIVSDIFINSRTDPSGNSGFLSGFKEITCSSELAPERQALSNIVILTAGGSEWLFLPDPEWSKCPITPPSLDLDTPGSDRWNLDDELLISSTPRNTDLPITSNLPNYRPRQPKETVNESRSETTTPYSWNDAVKPRLPDHDHYGRNGSNSQIPINKDGYHYDHVHEDDDQDHHTSSNATEENLLKESSISGDAIIASSIVGVLAVLLLAIGCCFLFRHLNLQGSYGIHSNTYEPQSSLHLRDSQYDNDNDQTAGGAANAASTATEGPSNQATPSASTSQQAVPQSSGDGAMSQTIDTSDGTPC